MISLQQIIVCTLIASAVCAKLYEREYIANRYSAGLPSAKLSKAPYAKWAHEHWVWLNGGRQTQQLLVDMVNGYLQRGIRVGCVNIDSGWSTGYNNFIWDKAKFPDPAGFVSQMHALGIKVIVWTTSMINQDSSNFQYAKDHNYLLNNGTLIKWWHGKGALFDYSNPEGLQWWHAQLKQVLDIGVDGWKCDGTDPYVYYLYLFPGGPQGYQGRVTYREYADSYYGDFFNYTNEVRGEGQGLIMSRPDANVVPEPCCSWFYLQYSPHYVMFSGWVGDQDGDFAGIRTVLRLYFHSAWTNYLNYGSDIGGYRQAKGVPGGRTKEVFIRWAQLGALSPLMENGGGGDHFPWQFDEQTVEIYRFFTLLHYELFPLFYSGGAECYAQNISIMKPLAARQSGDISFRSPAFWEFTLWGDLHVSPVTENVTTQTVNFPRFNRRWVDYWTRQVYRTRKLENYSVPLAQYPIFWRQGALIPLNVTSNESLYGSTASAGFLTFLIPFARRGQLETRQIRDEEDGGGQTVTYEYGSSGGALFFTATAYNIAPIIIVDGAVQVGSEIYVMDQIRGGELEQFATLQAFNAADKGFYLDQAINRLWVRGGASANGWALYILNINIEDGTSDEENM